MKLFTKMITITGLAAAMVSCADKGSEFKYLMDEFADIKIIFAVLHPDDVTTIF